MTKLRWDAVSGRVRLLGGRVFGVGIGGKHTFDALWVHCSHRACDMRAPVSALSYYAKVRYVLILSKGNSAILPYWSYPNRSIS